MTKKYDFTFIDLFAGIGGFRYGFEDIGGKCIFTSENDKFAQQTYIANHGPDNVFGDINEIKVEDIPSHNILLAGFPCQPFSSAGTAKRNKLGRKHAFEDETQGNLFFKIVEILKYHQPDMFMLENVKNIMSHSKGEVWNRITKELIDTAGYNIYYRIIDARHFVPQHRERVFIIGFPQTKSINFIFDNITFPNNPYRLGHILEDNVDDRYTLTDHQWAYQQAHKRKHSHKGNGFGYGLVDASSITRTLTHRYYKDGAEILIRQWNKNPRRLTPRECARLMGFDDSFIIPVSNTQAYRQFGNAVVVPLIKYLANYMNKRMDLILEK